MKKLLFYIIALLSVATALSGCKKDEEATELPPPVISVKEPKTYSCGEKSVKELNWKLPPAPNGLRALA